MISYIIPTRDRPTELERTLDAIGMLGDHRSVGGAEVIVIDNASARPVRCPALLRNGLRVGVIRAPENLGASARNLAATNADARSDWLVMLDDDSAPMNDTFVQELARVDDDVAVLSADIMLGESPGSIIRREDGGLPEVFVGCGAAIRRHAFERVGGYDASFGFYAEEYDLSAKVLLAGYRVRFCPAFRVLHRKVQAGRDINMILRRLVRNSGWVVQRYAPDAERSAELDAVIRRCRWIAEREQAMAGFEAGHEELLKSLGSQQRTPMPVPIWERFTGLSWAREAIAQRLPAGVGTVSLVHEGKQSHIVRRAIQELGLVETDGGSEVRIIGTLSPGPMLDALAGCGDDPRVVAPWLGATLACARARFAA
ncbi:MAG TPA: glycosyltransferase [Phycisphaerales bacterium]|nr:glycosyltransferase [Phycisphaerales bacterium]